MRVRGGNLPVALGLVQRLDAAKSRIESLNPLVTVEDERFESIVKTVDLVCVTDWDERGIVSMSSSSISKNLPILKKFLFYLQSDSYERDMSKTPKAILCWRVIWTYWLHFLRSFEA
jgi:hypothetical protein